MSAAKHFFNMWIHITRLDFLLLWKFISLLAISIPPYSSVKNHFHIRFFKWFLVFFSLVCRHIPQTCSINQWHVQHLMDLLNYYKPRKSIIKHFENYMYIFVSKIIFCDHLLLMLFVVNVPFLSIYLYIYIHILNHMNKIGECSKIKAERTNKQRPCTHTHTTMTLRVCIWFMSDLDWSSPLTYCSLICYFLFYVMLVYSLVPSTIDTPSLVSPSLSSLATNPFFLLLLSKLQPFQSVSCHWVQSGIWD